MYGFVPSAGAVLADWGADVIKVEHAVNGDPQRGLRQTGTFRVEGDPNPNIEHANRGKRSLGLDMARPEGRALLDDLDRPEWADDPRFATAEQLALNTAEAVKLLREVIATRTLAEWSERFATLAGPWAPVQDTLQVAADAQVRANEYLCQAGGLRLVASPAQFDVSAPELGPAPEFAAQTEEILLELGLEWDQIMALKAAGAVT